MNTAESPTAIFNQKLAAAQIALQELADATLALYPVGTKIQVPIGKGLSVQEVISSVENPTSIEDATSVTAYAIKGNEGGVPRKVKVTDGRVTLYTPPAPRARAQRSPNGVNAAVAVA